MVKKSLLYVLFLESCLFGQATMIGNPIFGVEGHDSSGTAVAINNFGDIIAVGTWTNGGSVRVFKNINNNWIQLGSEM
jgi:hypothetical protein